VAYYKQPNYFKQDTGSAFDLVHAPGVKTPYSGIYRCDGCGREDVSIKGAPLPPQNHHQHTPSQGSIRWRLIAATHPV
jgi:hypothetical protein